MTTGILILAAGAASRIGRAKMLLPFRDTNILSHILNEVRSLNPHCICLVTGYYHKEILAAIDTRGLYIAHNEHWEEGMGASIRMGVSELMKMNTGLSSLIIIVSDQPYLNSNVLQEMIDTRIKTKKGIIAAKYGQIKGTPVLFDQKYFSLLLLLKGDTGAKFILQQNTEDIATVEFSLGEIDIDTQEDYEKLSKKN
jgi:molybdenum cofactor cytidylyltransferase